MYRCFHVLSALAATALIWTAAPTAKADPIASGSAFATITFTDVLDASGASLGMKPAGLSVSADAFVMDSNAASTPGATSSFGGSTMIFASDAMDFGLDDRVELMSSADAEVTGLPPQIAVAFHLADLVLDIVNATSDALTLEFTIDYGWTASATATSFDGFAEGAGIVDIGQGPIYDMDGFLIGFDQACVEADISINAVVANGGSDAASDGGIMTCSILIGAGVSFTMDEAFVGFVDADAFASLDGVAIDADATGLFGIAALMVLAARRRRIAR